MSRTLWITGATGFVGSHFAYHVLKTTDARIVAIVREKRESPARERLLNALAEVAFSYRELLNVDVLADRLVVVHGDIEQAACGVDMAKLPVELKLDGCEFWHSAASLCFEERQRAQIRRQNVEGTRHALALAERLGSTRFAYVSTAYTCGRCEGEIPEQLHDLDREFNNAYEQSKCEAEHEVAAWSQRTGRRAAILRPSIVVGPRHSYLPGGSDTGLYGFARETARLKRMLKSSPTQLRMLGHAEAPVNLIPVDDLVRAMCERADEDFAGGLVHHLTSERVPHVASLLAIVGEQCGAGPLGVVATREERASPVEQVMDRRAAFYASYLRAPKTFARRAGARISVSDEELACFVRGYLRHCRNETADAVFTKQPIRSERGDTLVSYRSGTADKPALVLVNAYGIPADVWVPLTSALQADFQLFSWELATHRESRGGPDSHVADLLRLLDHHGVAQAYIAGFCTGADLALRFAASHPERVLGAISLSGALNSLSACETTFQRNMRKLARSAARSLEHARLYHQLLFGQRRGHYGALAVERSEEAMLASMVGSLDPALLHLTSAPFRDPESLYAYAQAMQAHYQDAEQHKLQALAVPALFITGSRDEVAHPAASHAAAALLSDSCLQELAGADHFALYSEPAVADAMRAFASRTAHTARSRAVARSAA